MLYLAGLKCQHNVEHFALLGLKHRLQRFLGFGRRLIGFHKFALNLKWLLIGGVLWFCGVNHHHFACQCGAFKAVLIFHIHHLAVYSRHSAASHIVEKAHYIVDFYHSSVVCVCFD